MRILEQLFKSLENIDYKNTAHDVTQSHIAIQMSQFKVIVLLPELLLLLILACKKKAYK